MSRPQPRFRFQFWQALKMGIQKRFVTHDSQARIPTKVAVVIGFKSLVRISSYICRAEDEKN